MHEKLHEQYQILKDVAREYLDSRQGAKSPEGKKRLKLADALYKHADKVLDNEEKLKEQVTQNQAPEEDSPEVQKEENPSLLI